ncbi:protein kinase domain-containing protein [Haematococcus lacustris]|uniref:Protein kinase domain-containing protein n=1 Tax=Haematococcus lacustris TaxID=44745 RepID=A0A699YN68_HAELA|nr:protein kinase domain-containing protein [Haematococcus lacustris]
MEWIDGLRCTDPDAIRASGIDVDQFIRCGVVSGLRQLLEFGLFHGDPHAGNIFAVSGASLGALNMRDGRIAYVDFGNVAQLSARNKGVLVDAVVHAVNEDYKGMERRQALAEASKRLQGGRQCRAILVPPCVAAPSQAGDFIKLGFLAPGTDIGPIVPALERIWANSKGQRMSDFNFRTVTSTFNELVYQYPIRIPERYSLQCLSIHSCQPRSADMALRCAGGHLHDLEARLPVPGGGLPLRGAPPAHRRGPSPEGPPHTEQERKREEEGRQDLQRCLAAAPQVLFSDGKFQWKRLENLISLAQEGGPGGDEAGAAQGIGTGGGTMRRGLDLSDTVRDAVRVLLLDDRLRSQVRAVAGNCRLPAKLVSGCQLHGQGQALQGDAVHVPVLLCGACTAGCAWYSSCWAETSGFNDKQLPSSFHAAAKQLPSIDEQSASLDASTSLCRPVAAVTVDSSGGSRAGHRSPTSENG